MFLYVTQAINKSSNNQTNCIEARTARVKDEKKEEFMVPFGWKCMDSYRIWMSKLERQIQQTNKAEICSQLTDPNTIINPWAMVVHFQNTPFTNATMVRSIWFIGFTPSADPFGRTRFRFLGLF